MYLPKIHSQYLRLSLHWDKPASPLCHRILNYNPYMNNEKKAEAFKWVLVEVTSTKNDLSYITNNSLLLAVW